MREELAADESSAPLSAVERREVEAIVTQVHGARPRALRAPAPRSSPPAQRSASRASWQRAWMAATSPACDPSTGSRRSVRLGSTSTPATGTSSSACYQRCYQSVSNRSKR
jgi:hypothetical protein